MEFWVVYLEDVETGKLRVSGRSPFSSMYEAQRYADGIAKGRDAKVLVEATHGVGLGLITEYARANGQRIQAEKEQKKRTDALRKKLKAKGIKLPKRKKELNTDINLT